MENLRRDSASKEWFLIRCWKHVTHRETLHVGNTLQHQKWTTWQQGTVVTKDGRTVPSPVSCPARFLVNSVWMFFFSFFFFFLVFFLVYKSKKVLKSRAYFDCHLQVLICWILSCFMLKLSSSLSYLWTHRTLPSMTFFTERKYAPSGCMCLM